MEAAQTIFAVESHPTDQQLDFNLKEARQQIKIEEFIRSAIASGEKLSPGAMAFALKNASVNDLLKLPPSERTFLAILARAKVSSEALDHSIRGLSNLREISEVDLALDLVERFDPSYRDSLHNFLHISTPITLPSFVSVDYGSTFFLNHQPTQLGKYFHNSPQPIRKSYHNST